MMLPMREKYVDEEVGIWIEFGVRRDEHGNTIGVDVADQKGDIFIALPPAIATQVCDAQARFRQELYNILCKEQA